MLQASVIAARLLSRWPSSTVGVGEADPVTASRAQDARPRNFMVDITKRKTQKVWTENQKSMYCGLKSVER